MSLSDLAVFNDYYAPAIHETMAQMVKAFNEASNGAIVLNAAGYSGDFLLNSFYDSLSAAQRRVDRYAAQAPVAGTNLSQTEFAAVKIAGGFGPIVWEPSSQTWLKKPTAEAIETISRQFAEALVADQLNTCIRALVAAIGGQVSLTKDVSGGASIDQSVLNDSHALFGDMSGSLVASVMNGAQYHKLIGLNIANAQNLYTATNVRVVDILGKKVIVTDSPALSGVGTYKVLSLVPNAGVVSDAKDPIVNIQTVNGSTRVESSLQADYDFSLQIKGFGWDMVNGGKSPTDAEIGTSTNWDLKVSNVKNAAGVIAIGDV